MHASYRTYVHDRPRSDRKRILSPARLANSPRSKQSCQITILCFVHFSLPLRSAHTSRSTLRTFTSARLPLHAVCWALSVTTSPADPFLGFQSRLMVRCSWSVDASGGVTGGTFVQNYFALPGAPTRGAPTRSREWHIVCKIRCVRCSVERWSPVMLLEPENPTSASAKLQHALSQVSYREPDGRKRSTWPTEIRI